MESIRKREMEHPDIRHYWNTWFAAIMNRETEMDTQVWSKHLPDEVIWRILAWLPTISFSRLRCVSKKWNSVVHDPGFSAMSAQIPSQAPWYLIHASNGYLAYIPATNVWKLLPFSFISPESVVQNNVVGSAGSMVLLRKGCWRQEEPGRLLIINPINGSQRELPPILAMGPKSFVIGMVLNQATGAYRILVVEKWSLQHIIGQSSVSQVYDSKKDSWEMSGSRVSQSSKQCIRGVALYEESLFCLINSQTTEHLGYQVYHVGEDSWDLVPARMPDLSSPHLFEYHGRLHLVGGYSMNTNSFSIYIWELDFLRLEWMVVKKIPDELVLRIFGHQHYTLVFLTRGDYMYFGRAQKTARLVIYNMLKDSWLLVPTIPKSLVATVDEGYGISADVRFLYAPRWEVVLSSRC